VRAQWPELQIVVIAFDADAGRKVEVQQALKRLGETLRGTGLDVRELKWEERLGKGIDDFLVKDTAHRNKVEEFLKESLASLNRSEVSVANPVSRDRSRDEPRPHQQEVAL